MANQTADYQLTFTDGDEDSLVIQNFTDDAANQKLIIAATGSMALLGDRLAELASDAPSISFMRRVSESDVEMAHFRADRTFVLNSSDLQLSHAGHKGVAFDADISTTTNAQTIIHQNGSGGRLVFQVGTGGSNTIMDWVTTCEVKKSVTANARVDASAQGFCTRDVTDVTAYTGTPADGAIAVRREDSPDPVRFYARANNAWRYVDLSSL